MYASDAFAIFWYTGGPTGDGSFDVRAVALEDVFDAWVFAARDAELALEAWHWAPSRDRAEAHAVYRAALDREECAAMLLETAAAACRSDARLAA